MEQLAGDIHVFVSKFKPMKNTLSGREERTLMKLIVHAETDEVGCVLEAVTGEGFRGQDSWQYPGGLLCRARQLAGC